MYSGTGLLAIQQSNDSDFSIYFVHEDPVTKGKRVTGTNGVLSSAVEFGPYGAEADGYNKSIQPRKFTSYERGPGGTDEAMIAPLQPLARPFRPTCPLRRQP